MGTIVKNKETGMPPEQGQLRRPIPLLPKKNGKPLQPRHLAE